MDSINISKTYSEHEKMMTEIFILFPTKQELKVLCYAQEASVLPP